MKKAYETINYDSFRYLVDNRDVTRARVNSIKASIAENGYCGAPIIVNEKMQVIDGQGRLQACRELKVPIPYVVHQGAGMKECRALNAHQRSWSLTDYVKSYRSELMDYKYLSALMDEFSADLGKTVLISSVSHFQNGGAANIVNGNFRMTEEQYTAARSMLNYEKRFMKFFNRLEGRTTYYYIAVGFCYTMKNVDNDRLLRVVEKKFFELPPVLNIFTAVDQIERIYNYKTREKTYILEEFKKYNDTTKKAKRTARKKEAK